MQYHCLVKDSKAVRTKLYSTIIIEFTIRAKDSLDFNSEVCSKCGSPTCMKKKARGSTSDISVYLL